MKVLTVIPFKKGIPQDDLTYFTAKDTLIGSIVSIPFRSKNILGLVVFSENASSAKGDIKNMDFNLRKVLETKENSIFRKEYLESAIETSLYFVASKSSCMTSLIPAIFREQYDEIAKFKKEETKKEAQSSSSLRDEKLLFQAPLADRIASYKTLIRSSFAVKKSVFIVLPTERDIETFYAALSHGIEQFAFSVHSGLSSKKIILKSKEILSTTHPVLILGTAPFLSIPRSDIGTIVLEHESSNSYKTIARPHIDMRVFVELFATKINTKLILSDTLLRFETITRQDTDGLGLLHPLSFRTNFAGEITIPTKEEKFKVLYDESVEEIKNTIAKKQNVFIFSLRKGLATQTVCRDCNQTVECETCLAPVVLYISRDGQKRIFSCNRCKRELDTQTKCKNCDSWNLMPLGIGTDTVVEEVKNVFPLNNKIFQLDKETAKTSKGAEKIIKEFEESEGAILVGTEMAFSYLQNKVPLSIIASFDSLWSIPNYKMSEKILHIMLGMVEKTKEKIIIQTKNDKDPAIVAFQNQNLLSFVREELEDRKKLLYPPYKRFIKIMHLGNKEETVEARKMLKEVFKEYNPEIFSGFVAKLSGKYTTNALIKIDPQKWSTPALSLNSSIDQNLAAKLLSLPNSFEVFVDPEDLL